jgi:hypothetical protein
MYYINTYKLESRNSKIETNSNDLNSKKQTGVDTDISEKSTNVWVIRKFGFKICFGFRVSDFEFTGRSNGYIGNLVIQTSPDQEIKQ